MSERDPNPTLDGEHQQVAPTEAEAEAVARSADPRRTKVMLGLGAGMLILAGGWYMLRDTGHVSTDNAYVSAESAQVTPLIAAPVAEVPVVNTEYVRRGQVVLRLDDHDARLAYEKALAAWLKARREFSQTSATSDSLGAQVEAREADIGQAHAQLQAAQSAFDKAKVDLARRQHLADDGVVSRDELTNFQNSFIASQSSLAEARQGVTQAEANRGAAQKSHAAQLALIQGTSIDTNPDVAAARAALDQAKLDLERTVIRAPVDGIITNRQVQVGQRVAPGNPVMMIVPVDRVYVDANFKEGQLTRVRPGQPATLVSDMYGGDVVFHGRVIGFAGGTGSAFALIPAQNATGNWIKVVQRVPVRIAISAKDLAAHPLRVGLSMETTIDVSGKRH